MIEINEPGIGLDEHVEKICTKHIANCVSEVALLGNTALDKMTVLLAKKALRMLIEDYRFNEKPLGNIEILAQGIIDQAVLPASNGQVDVEEIVH